MIKVFIFAFTVSIVIGPVAVLIINYGLSGGVKKALIGSVGVCIANFIMTFSAYSLNILTEEPLPVNDNVVKIIASVLLIGFGSWISYNAITKELIRSKVNCNRRKMHPFIGAFLLAIVNPLSFIAYFTFSKELNVMSFDDSFIFGLTSSIAALIAMVGYAIFSGYYLSKISNPSVLKFINIGSGILIIGFGISNFIF